MERRPLATAVQGIPNADPAAVRQFVTQERTPPAQTDGRRASLANLTPVGLIPVTVRLRPALAGALKRASLERQLAGEEVFTQQELVEQALEPWLRSLGYLS
jgi:hypothetical protein